MKIFLKIHLGSEVKLKKTKTSFKSYTHKKSFKVEKIVVIRHQVHSLK